MSSVKKVACVGSGLVGQGWATLFATHGYEVVMQDLTKNTLVEAKNRVERNIKILYLAELIEDMEKFVNRIYITTSLEDALNDVDFVQESVYESYQAKIPLFSEMDRLTEDNVVLSSSTSGLMMTRISSEMERYPERAIVSHPYNPVHLVPLVELCPGEKTSQKTIDLAYELMKNIDRVPVILRKEVPGFIANRLSAALWREALDLVDKGVASVEDVDKAVKAGPGIRWAIMGPYMTYHLGGGRGGIEYLMRHIGVKKAEWLKNMAKWNETPESAIKKAVEGVEEIVKERSLEELERWRDEYLLALNKLLWSDKSKDIYQ